jgi:hypothetical protein
MSHPNLVDKIKAKLNHHFLFPGEMCQPTSNISVALIHKISPQSSWTIVDYIKLKKGSLLKYLGTGKDFKLSGDLLTTYSLFEMIDVSADRQIGTGDIVALTPSERPFLAKAAPTSASDAKLPVYFSASDE